MLRLVTLLCLAATALGAPRLDGRIVGGENADIADYPYQLSLQIAGNHECGAVIISPQWAVTAAQCAGGPIQDLLLRAGSANRNEPDDNVGTSHAVIQKILHPNYDPATSDYDLALLQVDPPFPELSKDILLPAEDWTGPPFDDVTVLGWGDTQSGGQPSDVLQKVVVPVITSSECIRRYSPIPVTDRMVCTLDHNGEKDACQGDSGGPLIYTDPALGEVLAGIVSWGRGCALPDSPGVYTRVSVLAGWIQDNIA